MIIHELKIERNYLEHLMSGVKKSEIRYNDRDYQKGDVIEFSHPFTGDLSRYKITHIHSGLGMKEGYVVLSVKALNESEERQGE